MSINQSHYQGGVVLFQGEMIVYCSKDIKLKFKGGPPIMSAKEHKGTLFVTTHRVWSSTIVINHGDLQLNQPILGANNIAGSVNAHPNVRTWSPPYQMPPTDFYEPPPPSYERAVANNNFAETNIFTTPVQTPYSGPFQFQSPKFIPQYHQPSVPSSNSSSQPDICYPPSYSVLQSCYSNTQSSMPNQNGTSAVYSNLNQTQGVQTTYQNNYNPNQIYVPQVQDYRQPPSYEQLIQKKQG
ncbi:unnamed protein product [Didymodactylos carnosus]|uniref:Uncharacterized protein n=1 Tax=Didymodactylos carnosus TaxID=1234261 RepID=A0A814GJQ4_9BILA|nr:unnamed protein product [Didymodactylos carnosus]CAF0997247.1 unnamed protein product [Didymodactylos carnosus]CAF3637721.1 unnamed protein product [Didymodactylos carnosus]CAF3768788.1 unnamed protein product [Didymodactylos carnosus]